MKIYIASNRENIALVKDYAAILEGRGHEITYKWWKDIEQNGPDDTKVNRGILERCAYNDWEGVVFADVFWLIAPAHGGTGCWVEFGMAYAEFGLNDDRKIIVSGAHNRTLFTTLSRITCCSSHDEALTIIN